MKLLSRKGVEVHFEPRHLIIGIEFDDEERLIYVWPLPMLLFILDR